MTKITGLERAAMIAEDLKVIAADRWAEYFVNKKMEFFRLHGKGLITSTAHGVDYFGNILQCAAGIMIWEGDGEYDVNFRQLVKELKHE
jgi:hypothetical protein